MKRLILIAIVLSLLVPTVFATEETDTLTEGLDEEVAELLPEPSESIDFWQSLKTMFFGAFTKANDSMKGALRLCAVLLALLTLCSVSQMRLFGNYSVDDGRIWLDGTACEADG